MLRNQTKSAKNDRSKFGGDLILLKSWEWQVFLDRMMTVQKIRILSDMLPRAQATSSPAVAKIRFYLRRAMQSKIKQIHRSAFHL